MFPSRHNNSPGEADTKRRPAARERSLPARDEHSERPVAGTNAAAQADQAGRLVGRTITQSKFRHLDSGHRDKANPLVALA
jgi:hypothetical protein